MFPFPSPLLMMQPASGGGGAPAIRFSGFVNSSNNQLVIPFSGASAGDRFIVFGVDGWGLSATPTGWTQLDSQTGSYASGNTHTKVLSSADITAGSVTFTYSGSYGGRAFYVCMTGAPNVRTSIAQRYASGSTSHTLTTDSSPVAGDLALLFGGNRDYNVTWTYAAGTAMGGGNGSIDFSAWGFNKSISVSGAFSATMTLNTTTSAEYMSIVVIAGS